MSASGMDPHGETAERRAVIIPRVNIANPCDALQMFQPRFQKTFARNMGDVFSFAAPWAVESNKAGGARHHLWPEECRNMIQERSFSMNGLGDFISS